MVIDTRDEEGGVRVLTLNRPPAHAIDSGLLDELSRACDAAARDDAVRAVVLTGSGKFFCGGLDLKSLNTDERELERLLDLGRDDGIFKLWTLPKPTVAMINGHAIAGGVMLTLACDIRIAVNSGAKIGLNEVAIGLAYPIAVFELVRLALTNESARRVMLGAGLHAPETARELGLVDELVEPARLAEVCFERARALGRHPRLAYAHAKQELQHEAIDRIRRETPAHRQSVCAVWKSDETTQLLNAQLAALGKKT